MSKEIVEFFHQILCACIKSVSFENKSKIKINKQQLKSKEE